MPELYVYCAIIGLLPYMLLLIKTLNKAALSWSGLESFRPQLHTKEGGSHFKVTDAQQFHPLSISWLIYFTWDGKAPI